MKWMYDDREKREEIGHIVDEWWRCKSHSRVSYFSIYVVFPIISDSYHILITLQQFLREFEKIKLMTTCVLISRRQFSPSVYFIFHFYRNVDCFMYVFYNFLGFSNRNVNFLFIYIFKKCLYWRIDKKIWQFSPLIQNNNIWVTSKIWISVNSHSKKPQMMSS